MTKRRGGRNPLRQTVDSRAGSTPPEALPGWVSNFVHWISRLTSVAELTSIHRHLEMLLQIVARRIREVEEEEDPFNLGSIDLQGVKVPDNANWSISTRDRSDE